MAAIEQGAREGLAELNSLVRRLRRADLAAEGNAPHPGGPPAAQPRLKDVPGLIARAKEAGLRASLVVDGDARPLADIIELAGYRVVQECLTNAIRHAGETAATVRLAYTRSGISIEVADAGPAAGPGARRATVGGGAGLAGLRERAQLLGGQFEASRQQDGFVVRASLPSPL